MRGLIGMKTKLTPKATPAIIPPIKTQVKQVVSMTDLQQSFSASCVGYPLILCRR